MAKRKITQYYRATKRSKNGVSLSRQSRSTTAPKNRRRKRKVVRRTTSKRRPKRKSLTKTTYGNIKTYLVENADVANVPPPATGTGADFVGQTCAYFATGCSAYNTPYIAGNCLALNGMAAVVNMADIIRKAEQDSGSAGPSGETRFMIKNSSQTYQLVNQANSVATVTAYFCLCQRDVQQISSTDSARDPRTILGDGFYQRGEQTAAVALPAPGTNNPQLFDALLSPFDSHRFCSFFKIYKTQTIKMDPGMNQSFILKSNSKFINYDHYTQFSSLQINGGGTTEASTLQYSHRKGEQFILFKVMGQPSDYNNNQATYTTPKIDMITKTHYNFCAINRQQPIIYRDFAVGFSQKATGTTANVMVDESGVAAADTKA